MTKLQAIRNFCSYVCEQKVTIARDKYSNSNWGMYPFEKNPRLKIPQNLTCKSDSYDKMFRANFIERCPLAQGFSNITLVLLHECGHWATRSILDIIEYDKMNKKASTMNEYMAIPWEHLATEWAICWLYSPVNRQSAKQFEKNYFNY